MSDNAATGAPEFSRLVAAPRHGAQTSISETARKAECAALADRFGVLSVDAFAATAKLAASAGGVLLTGKVSARLTQRCVVTMEPISTTVEESFQRRFLPGARIEAGADFDPEAEDPPEPLTDEIDIGEIAAEAAALAIDPYPRATDVEVERLSAAPPDAAPLDDAAARPFAGLAALKRRLEASDDDGE